MATTETYQRNNIGGGQFNVKVVRGCATVEEITDAVDGRVLHYGQWPKTDEDRRCWQHWSLDFGREFASVTSAKSWISKAANKQGWDGSRDWLVIEANVAGYRHSISVYHREPAAPVAH